MTETTMTTPGNAGWISYSGPDLDKAKSFYSDVLGWTIQEMPMQDGSSHSAVMVNGAPIGGFSPMPQDGGAWTIYVTVEDVDGAIEKAKSSGAKVLSEPLLSLGKQLYLQSSITRLPLRPDQTLCCVESSQYASFPVLPSPRFGDQALHVFANHHKTFQKDILSPV